ncbi:MAG: hypothetical protein ISS49_15435 [Anaerolineae bacterium]|nr:hypothetical protein [Anaerolineae bacterium]
MNGDNAEIKKKAGEKPDFEYIIKVDDEKVWQGLNVKQKYIEIVQANPTKRVSIAWRLPEAVLICLL